MRYTTEELLFQFPSMAMSKSGLDALVPMYYGDIPRGTLTTGIDKPESPIGAFIAGVYAPREVDEYSYRHGYGYCFKDDGTVIAGHLSIKYGAGYAWSLYLFNHHLGQTGFEITKQDTGKCSVIGFTTHNWSRLGPYPIREIIDGETLSKIFRRVERSDEYGEFPRRLVRTAWRLYQKDVKEEYDV